MKKVVIFGTGDFARIAYAYLDEDSAHAVAAFSVHQQYLSETTLLDTPIVPFEELTRTHPPDEFAMLVAVGFRRMNHARAEIYDACKAAGYELITYVSPKAMVSRHARIGDNCFIFENNVIQPFVTIGNDVIVWSGNHIGHDSKVGDHCFIASHAVISGNVTIGPYCFVGVNATFRDGINVGAESLIGAGALIIKDTKPGEVYAAKGTEPAAIPSSRVRSFQ
jgi:sugar O-acyltransferase (sialic acid O-acetyltransferase NeuD family)